MFREVQDFVVTFSSILWEAMPFIVLGAVVAGVLEELLPQQVMSRIVPRSAIPAAVLGGLLGLVFPMCECGIVVVMRRLLRKGLPLACCIAYMLAGPIVNVVVMLSTYVAFGGLNPLSRDAAWTMLGLRVGLGFVTAVVTGCAVHLLQRTYPVTALLTPIAVPLAPAKGGLSLNVVDEEEAKAERRSPFKRLANISETALHDFLDITVFLILGAALAAVVKLYIDPADLTALSRDMPYLAIPAMMVMAVLMCLCSEADAFVAASFTEMTLAPKLAFLVLGPMFDLKLLLMYTRVFRPRLIGVIVVCTVIQVMAYTMLVHTFYTAPPAAGGATAPATTATGK
ncbi:MAG: permease [Gemmataceae bacterium]